MKENKNIVEAPAGVKELQEVVTKLVKENKEPISVFSIVTKHYDTGEICPDCGKPIYGQHNSVVCSTNVDLHFKDIVYSLSDLIHAVCDNLDICPHVLLEAIEDDIDCYEDDDNEGE